MLSSLALTENLDSTQNNFLQAYEIASMELNANLIVLSACETGFGKFEQGEGIMSLARSFMYAGTPSLVVSLWSVNDQSTSIIMQDFYKNLIANMPKNEALRQAKLNYIQRATGVAAHPAFWSPFIQLGNEEAIVIQTKSSSIYWFIGIGSILILFLGITFFLKRKNN
jgi:CHAT domain-containing protein